MHLMIDLETLSLQNNAVVTQIGWATFDPRPADKKFGVLSSGAFILNADEQVKRGRHFSYSTFQWWMDQSDEARKLLIGRNSKAEMSEILATFVGSFKWDEIDGLWSNGLLFDIAILDDMFWQYDIKTPWHYRAPRDYKTLRALRPNSKGPKPAVAHSAEHDAISQAIEVQMIMHSLLNEAGA